MDLKALPGRVLGRLDRQFALPLRRRRRARANANRRFEPLFVTGAMGSGTTLLGLELYQSFETAGVIDESCLIAPKEDLLSIDAIATHDRIASFLDALSPDATWSAERAGAETQRLYRAECASIDAPVIDKAANAHLCRTAFLAECDPAAFFLVIVRDPVANIEGFRRKWPVFGADRLEENIRFYRAIHERFLVERDAWGDRSIVLSYEALVADPEATRNRIEQRTGLARRSASQSLAARPNRPGQGVRNVGADGVGIVRDANAQARRNVSASDGVRIQDALGDLHAELLALAENVE